MFLYWSNWKNGGTCVDNNGTAKFSCTCTEPFDGERCLDNPCQRYPCLNNGNCIVKQIISGEKTPACDCPENTDGPNCNLLFCGRDHDVPCYNRGTCKLNSTVYEYYLEYFGSEFKDNYEYYIYYLGEFEACQCSQENGIAKYHGESCEIPGSDACAGSPCQNGGSCTTIIQGETQACFIKKF